MLCRQARGDECVCVYVGKGGGGVRGGESRGGGKGWGE